MSNDTQEGGQAADTKVETKVEAKPVELTPIEKQASEQGWVPLKDWEEAGNDASEWRPAKEFVDRGELYRTIHNTRRELKQAQGALTALQRHHQNVLEKAQRQALEELKRERRMAVREENLERAEQIEDQIDELRVTHEQERQTLQKEQAQTAPVGPPPEFVEWTNRNPWYLMNPEMQEYAEVTGVVYAKRNPNSSPATVLKHIEDQVKKQFPEKFGVRRAAPNPTAAVDRTPRRSTTAGDDVELDDNERAIMEDLVRNKVMTAEAYKAELKKYKR